MGVGGAGEPHRSQKIRATPRGDQAFARTLVARTVAVNWVATGTPAVTTIRFRRRWCIDKLRGIFSLTAVCSGQSHPYRGGNGHAEVSHDIQGSHSDIHLRDLGFEKAGGQALTKQLEIGFLRHDILSGRHRHCGIALQGGVVHAAGVVRPSPSTCAMSPAI